MITVLVVDDSEPIRKTLRDLLQRADDIELVATAVNGIDAIEKGRSHQPNVAVMDISMPLMDGLEATGHFREYCRLTRVVIISSFDTSPYIQRALDVGAKGYVLKDNIGAELLKAIRAIHGGSHYFSERIAGIARNHLSFINQD